MFFGYPYRIIGKTILNLTVHYFTYPNKEPKNPLDEFNFFSASAINCRAFCSLSAISYFCIKNKTAAEELILTPAYWQNVYWSSH